MALQEPGLLAIAQLLVAGLVLHADPLVAAWRSCCRASMSAWWIFSALVLVCCRCRPRSRARRARPRSAPSCAHDDADAALGPDHVLHEEGGLAHHRAPAGLVPADRAVVEGDLQMAVVVHPRLDLVGEPGADAVHAHRLGAGHLAHDVDVVHAAIDDRASAISSGSCASSRRRRCSAG